MDNRNIDKLIAEKVMGWELNDEGVAWETEFGELFFTYPYDDDNEWSPSTDIKDAWLVVEKFNYVYLFRMDDWNENKYECKLIFDNDRSFYGIGETAPMAICLAALKALGIDIEQL